MPAKLLQRGGFFRNIFTRGLPITVNDPNTELTLTYIDDVVDKFRRVLDGQQAAVGPITHTL